MSGFIEAYEKQFVEPVGIPGFQMNRPYVVDGPAGDVGLELEIEGQDLPSQGSLEKIVGGKTKSQWSTKTDGSLRGEALEYVLSTPCSFEEINPLVSGLYSKFKSIGTELRLTNRCSTHVHVNMAGKKVNEITSAIALWTAFEEPLTLWAGEERVNNHFCLTSKDSNNGTVQAWRGFLRSGSRNFRDNLKYSALNILTLHRFGSIEYRVMNASEDPQRIIDWSRFVFTLTRYAGEQFNNPRSLLYTMSERGGRDLFRDICERAGVTPAFVLGVENTVSDLDRTVLEGFRRAQPLVAGPDWDAWMPEINKEFIPNPFGDKKGKKGNARELIEGIDWDLAAATGRGPIDLEFRPRTLRPRMDAAPTAPAPPPPGPRPAFVPEGFVNVFGNWQHPEYDSISRSLNIIQRNAPSITTHFDNAMPAPVDWTQPVEFADGSPAVVLKVRGRGIMAVVSSTENKRTDVASLTDRAWYDTATGLYSGGRFDGIHPVVRNIRR